MSQTIEQPADTHMGNMGYETAPEITLPATSTNTQTLINDAVKEVTVGEDGKYVYPENMNPMLKAAVAATKSYRDNQSGYTKSQQSLKEAEATVEALRNQLVKNVQPLELPPEEKARLDTLLETDPNAWRKEMNKLDTDHTETVTKLADEVTDEVRATTEIQRRVGLLEGLNASRENPVTVDMLDNDVPARINNKLADGSITFEAYLVEASTYIDADKTIATTTDTKTTSLETANGSSTASTTKQEDEIDYSTLTF